jgi:hypothetical protein
MLVELKAEAWRDDTQMRMLDPRYHLIGRQTQGSDRSSIGPGQNTILYWTLATAGTIELRSLGKRS